MSRRLRRRYRPGSSAWPRPRPRKNAGGCSNFGPGWRRPVAEKLRERGPSLAASVRASPGPMLHGQPRSSSYKSGSNCSDAFSSPCSMADRMTVASPIATHRPKESGRFATSQASRATFANRVKFVDEGNSHVRSSGRDPVVSRLVGLDCSPPVDLNASHRVTHPECAVWVSLLTGRRTFQSTKVPRQTASQTTVPGPEQERTKWRPVDFIIRTVDSGGPPRRRGKTLSE